MDQIVSIEAAILNSLKDKMWEIKDILHRFLSGNVSQSNNIKGNYITKLGCKKLIHWVMLSPNNRNET